MIAGLVIVSTAVTAIGGFLVAAMTLDRRAATVALVASAGLTLGVLVGCWIAASMRDQFDR